MRRFNFNTKTVENIDIYDVAHCDRKSFYGKAKIIETESAFYLLSYSTIVCKVDKATRSFTRFWNGESSTTMRHINSFLRDFNMSGGGVHWWRDQAIIDPSKTEFDIADKIADNATFNATYY